MAGYLNKLGNSPSINILPANRSLVTADSRYRRILDLSVENPYNFTAYVSSALVGKELIYQKLYWNQPIFCHNNANCELIFQINGDESTTYVVYATPFQMYNQYDGNAPGIPWGVPQAFSYAKNMELAFNGDVRLLGSNMQLCNQSMPNPGYLYDSNGNQMTVYFRYSPVQGFSISFAPSVPPTAPYCYTIRLLPCSYISGAHYVHGIGIYDENSGSPGYVPRDQWTVAYFSDDTPNLLPFRYITVRSDELTKDRRMISFQNANSSRFQNELAIMALSRDYTGVYHTENVGDDATVISKRDDYQPQTFKMIITDEHGDYLQCDSPISNMLQSTYVNENVKSSFLFGALAGRGDPIITNSLVFGARKPIVSVQSFGMANPHVSIPIVIANPPNGVSDGVSAQSTMFKRPLAIYQIGQTFFQWAASSDLDAYSNFANPIIITPSQQRAYFPATPDSYNYVGLNYVQNPIAAPLAMNACPVGTVAPALQQIAGSTVVWDPVRNPNPGARFDAVITFIQNIAPNPNPLNTYVFCAAWSYTVNDWVMNFTVKTNLFQASTSPIGTVNFYDSTGGGPQAFSLNPEYAPYETQHEIGFFIICGIFQIVTRPLTCTNNIWINDIGNPIVGHPPIFKFYNMSLIDSQSAYISPTTNESGYDFGNPLAIAKDEELIHEIGLIMDKN